MQVTSNMTYINLTVQYITF
uniref:Uncharacterized protein n=1 Tax=Lepeophtheirus salmonis TaxID=72036 RepID=A0A0K2V8G2_LEPSM